MQKSARKAEMSTKVTGSYFVIFILQTFLKASPTMQLVVIFSVLLPVADELQSGRSYHWEDQEPLDGRRSVRRLGRLLRAGRRAGRRHGHCRRPVPDSLSVADHRSASRRGHRSASSHRQTEPPGPRPGSTPPSPLYTCTSSGVTREGADECLNFL